MPQYIKESLWMDLLKFFGKQQDQNKQSRLIKNMRKTNPEMADAFANWDTESYKLLQATKKVLQKYGKSTSDVDDMLKQWD